MSWLEHKFEWLANFHCFARCWVDDKVEALSNASANKFQFVAGGDQGTLHSNGQ